MPMIQRAIEAMKKVSANVSKTTCEWAQQHRDALASYLQSIVEVSCYERAVAGLP